MLKIRTKEVLYEKYRTEKLLARRATRNISEDETRRLLEGEYHHLSVPLERKIDILTASYRSGSLIYLVTVCASYHSVYALPLSYWIDWASIDR